MIIPTLQLEFGTVKDFKVFAENITCDNYCDLPLSHLSRIKTSAPPNALEMRYRYPEQSASFTFPHGTNFGVNIFLCNIVFFGGHACVFQSFLEIISDLFFAR